MQEWPAQQAIPRGWARVSELFEPPIMEPEDETVRLRADRDSWKVECEHLRKLLAAVHDAGRPHSDWQHNCPKCAAWLSVRKELRGE